MGKLLFAAVTSTIEITEPLPSILSIAPQDRKLLSKILTRRVGHAPAKGWGWESLSFVLHARIAVMLSEEKSQVKNICGQTSILLQSS